MVTKIGKLQQKIGYNSACIWDIIKILAPSKSLLGRPI